MAGRIPVVLGALVLLGAVAPARAGDGGSRLLGVSPRPGRTTAIEFNLAEAQEVHLTLRDRTGRLVDTLADGLLAAGRHERLLDSSRLSGGAYLASFDAGGVRRSMKLLVVK